MEVPCRFVIGSRGIVVVLAMSFGIEVVTWIEDTLPDIGVRTCGDERMGCGKKMLQLVRAGR